MDVENVKEIIRRELPHMLQTDPELQETIRNMSQDTYADKRETESRFDRLLDELRREREESSRKWYEMTREQNRRWAEQTQRLDEMTREQNSKWEEQNRKWEENQQQHEQHASRMLVISPMVDHRAQEVAASLGIQVYSHALDVDPSVFT